MKKKSCLSIIIIIILFIIFFNVYKTINKNKMLNSQIVFSYISKPYNIAEVNIKNYCKFIKVFFENKMALNNELNKLNEENIRLKTENNILKSLAYKSSNLEELLELKQSINFKSKGARILYFYPSHWYKKAVIDLGKNQGIVKGFAFISPQGYVGQVCQISNNSSIIESVTNENTAISGMIQRNNIQGLVIGDGTELLTMTYIKLNADVKIGDTVSTGGDGEFIPTGIPIGKIINIKEDKLTNSLVAYIKPFVDFNDINKGLIMISENPLNGELNERNN